MAAVSISKPVVATESLSAAATPQVSIRSANPLAIEDWDSRVAALGGSFFHTRAWAQVLHSTYGHSPCYCAHCPEGIPAAVLPLMEVRSPFAGNRGIALPFTDACGPVSRDPQVLAKLYDFACELGRTRSWRYVEFRSGVGDWRQAKPAVQFLEHQLALGEGPETVLARMEPAVRRAIRKASGAGIGIRFETSAEAMREYYQLHCLTRQRHGLPPQPGRFFENISQYMLASGKGFVVSACMGNRRIAAAVFFYFGNEAIYKFGASDFECQSLRPNNLVMWEAIKWFATHGFERLHLGRTSVSNTGLARFKRGFGATEKQLEYFRYALPSGSWETSADRANARWLNHLFRQMPSPLLRLAGRVLYPHLS